MKELCMGEVSVKFGDIEMFHLSKCIHKVKRLIILDCGITFYGLKDLSKAIMNLNEPVRMCFIRRLKKVDKIYL